MEPGICAMQKGLHIKNMQISYMYKRKQSADTSELHWLSNPKLSVMIEYSTENIVYTCM